MVIKLLQNGECLITNDTPFAGVTNGKVCIQLNLRVFWNLVDKGLIGQKLGHPHNFGLTEAGYKLKVN